jgi:hypothetical protein
LRVTWLSRLHQMIARPTSFLDEARSQAPR